MPKGVQFKVRPRQAAHVVPCATELSGLLACFASTGDMKAADTCATAAQNLHHCMATNKKIVKPHKPSINYLLRKIK